MTDTLPVYGRLEADIILLRSENQRLRDLLRGFRDHYGDPVWHDRVAAEIGPGIDLELDDTTWTCHRCDAMGFLPMLPTQCKEAECPIKGST